MTSQAWKDPRFFDYEDEAIEEEKDYEEEVDEEDVSHMTLEEYKKSLQTKKTQISYSKPPRKSGEGEDLATLYAQIKGNLQQNEGEYSAEYEWSDSTFNLLQTGTLKFKPSPVTEIMNWRDPQIKGIIPRSSHASVLIGEGPNRRILVIAGYSSSSFTSSCFLIDPVKCNVSNPNYLGLGTEPVAAHSAVYDPLHKRVIVVGGVALNGRKDQVKVLTLSDDGASGMWGERHNANPINQREEQKIEQFRKKTTSFDRSNLEEKKGKGKPIFWCGCSEESDRFKGHDKHPKPEFYKDHWADHVVLQEKGTSFKPRSGHTLTLVNKIIWVIGGNSIDPRIFCLHVSDNLQSRRVINSFGDKCEAHNYLIRWTIPNLSGPAPSPREGHTATLVKNHLIYVIGGKSKGKQYSDLHILNTIMNTWSKPSLQGIKLPPLSYHSATLVGENIVLFGGYVNGKPLNQIYILNTRTYFVSQLNVGGRVPITRGAHSAHLFDDKIIIIGGHDGTKPISNVDYLENVFDTSSFQSTLGSDLFNYWKLKKSYDVTFYFPKEKKKIQAHKVVLSARSPVFLNYFLENQSKDDIPVSQSYQSWLYMMEYIYSDTAVVTIDTVFELLELAEKYELKHLEAICESTRNNVIVPPSSFLHNLRWTYNNKTFSDCRIEVEGKMFYSHQVILCARCPYFQSMFSSSFKEADEKFVTIEAIDSELFSSLLKYLVCDSLELNPQLAYDLIAPAHMYELKQLQERCEKYLLNFVDENNACLLLNVAKIYKSEELKEACLQWIAKNYFLVQETQEFAELDEETLEEISKLRVNMGKTSSITTKPTAAKKEATAQNCSKCGLPFVYQTEFWSEQKKPKEILNEWVAKYEPRCVPQYIFLLLGGWRSTRLILPLVKANGKKDFELIVKLPTKTKQESEHNAALRAYHILNCDYSFH